MIPDRPVAVWVIDPDRPKVKVETAHVYVHERGISFVDLGYGLPVAHHVIHVLAGGVDPSIERPTWTVGSPVAAGVVTVNEEMMPAGYPARRRLWVERVGISREDVWQAIREEVTARADLGDRII